LEGGTSELYQILTQAHKARQTLLKCNLKLVMSIARNWRRQNAGTNGHDTTAGQHAVERHDIPSLEELVQEGMIGLSKAVDKFDESRDLKLSTYATYWITSFVRLAVTNAKSTVLKLPPDLFQINRRYHRLMKEMQDQMHIKSSTNTLRADDDEEDYGLEEHSDEHNNSNLSSGGVDMYQHLSLDEAARTLGVTAKRLDLALRCTQPILSLDAPLSGGSSSGARGSSAGGGDAGAMQFISLMDTLSTEKGGSSNHYKGYGDVMMSPEEYVELSFLRQTLETVMSVELSPYERDIIRLRLGLDNGECLTIRQVMDVYSGMGTSTGMHTNTSFDDDRMTASSSSSNRKQASSSLLSSHIHTGSIGIGSMSDVRTAERRAYRKLRNPYILHAYHLEDFLQE
jgi:RNA polymerase sigma factor (sigma-70 family)